MDKSHIKPDPSYRVADAVIAKAQALPPEEIYIGDKVERY